MPQSQDAAAAALPDDIVERVLDVVRQLARETGGVRAARAVAAQASLERDVGLGSLERVELLARLERAFGRPLDDASLAVDTAAGLARAVLEAAPSEPLRLPAPVRAPGGGERDRRRRPQPVRRRCCATPSSSPSASTSTCGATSAPATSPSATAGCSTRPRPSRAACASAASRAATPSRSCCRPGLDFLRSFFGILLLRAIPVPIYPPLRLDRLEEYARRQSAILADASVKLLVTIARARPVTSLLQPGVPTLRRRRDRGRARGGRGRASPRPTPSRATPPSCSTPPAAPASPRACC